MRTIRVEVARVGGDALEVTGRLVDEHPGSRRAWFGLDYGPTIIPSPPTILSSPAGCS